MRKDNISDDVFMLTDRNIKKEQSGLFVKNELTDKFNPDDSGQYFTNVKFKDSSLTQTEENVQRTKVKKEVIDKIAYDNLFISTFEIIHILDFCIENEINNHAILKFSGIIDESMKNEYIHFTQEQTPIEAYYLKGEENYVSLFDGVITCIKIKAIDEVYKIYVEAKSFTYYMDIYQNYRSFQNVNMTTHQVINQIMKSYKDAKYQINIPDEPIGNILLQYKETDWEFLKRIASKYHSVLLSSQAEENLAVYIGTPDLLIKSQEQINNYTISKDVVLYKDFSCNEKENIEEKDFVVYKLYSSELYAIGEHFTFKGEDVYVKKGVYTLKEAMLMNFYILAMKEGIKTKRLFNNNIIGISIYGTVAEVKRDTVKVNLEIEEEKEVEELYWFPYSSVASSTDGGGWYCMPEIGERVRINFPTKNEEEAFSVNSIDTYNVAQPNEQDRMSNPENKSLQTDAGQEVKFTPDGVLIECTGSNATMNLKKDGSVTMNAQKSITLACTESLSMNAINSIRITAKENIDILCKSGGQVELTKDNKITAKGTRILSNG